MRSTNPHTISSCEAILVTIIDNSNLHKSLHKILNENKISRFVEHVWKFPDLVPNAIITGTWEIVYPANRNAWTNSNSTCGLFARSRAISEQFFRRQSALVNYSRRRSGAEGLRAVKNFGRRWDDTVAKENRENRVIRGNNAYRGFLPLLSNSFFHFFFLSSFLFHDSIVQIWQTLSTHSSRCELLAIRKSNSFGHLRKTQPFRFANDCCSEMQNFWPVPGRQEESFGLSSLIGSK